MTAEVKEDLTEFLLHIVDLLVSDPESVRLNSAETQTMIAFELVVPNSEMGKMIGAEGSTIKAVRHLLVCAARMRNVRVNLDLLPLEQPSA
jgi:predicted RNA-binding protein YlqC (UPF0109 family)